ncbi:MAG: hypothetical protein ACOYMF_05220 [Bacteroidales bacterium]
MAKLTSLSNQEAEFQYGTWIKILIDLISPKNLFLVGGRGMAKSSEILAERSITIIYDMPRASFCFISNTYVNLLTNILPAIFQGWERKKFYEGFHYVVDKQPPAHWSKPLVPIIYFGHTISTFNGCKFYLKSLDRPSINAGISVAHLFGDEARYLNMEKLKRVFPTLRGDASLLSHSHYFMGQSFCTDMPNPATGDDAWIMEMEKHMDKATIVKIIQTALVVNDLQIEVLMAKRKQLPIADIKNMERTLDRWKQRLRKIRHGSTFFYIVSSLANVDVLTLEYIQNMFNSLGPEEFNTAVLSLKGSLKKEQRFYFNLSDRVFFTDGYDYEYYDRFGLKDNITQSSKGLRYCLHDKPLEAGFDAGNMMSLVVGQDQGNKMRALKFLYTLVPQFIDDLGRKFTEFFSAHNNKVLYLYFDRSANNYSVAKKDFATQLKRAIEKQDGKPTGWNVMLMSVGQRNIEHWEEYQLVNAMLSGHHANLPTIEIDSFECKELKSSLELAPMEKVKGKITKVKKSEKLATHRLPMESTNPSDAFKYWICRKKFMQLLKGRMVLTSGDPKVR